MPDSSSVLVPQNSAEAPAAQRLAARCGLQCRLLGAAAVVLGALFVIELLDLMAPAWAAQLLGSWHEPVRRSGAALLLLALATSVGLTAWLISTQRKLRLERARAAAIDQAIGAMNVGVAVWDRLDRLVAFNPAFAALYPELRDALRAGITYAELAGSYYDLADAAVRAGRSRAQFIADGLARRRGQQLSEVLRRHGDRRVLMTECRTPDGGQISFRMDVGAGTVLDPHVQQQRRVLDDLADLTSDWYWRTDAHGRFVEFSAAMEGFLGWRAEELVGRTRRDIPGFEADAGELAAHQALVDARQPFPWFTYRATRADGKPVWIDVTGRPVSGDDGAFAGYYGAAREVSERESVLAALRHSEERLRALTALATEWYWETDAELCFTLIRGPHGSSAWVAAELAGKPLLQLAQHADFRVDWPLVAGHLARREPFRRIALRIDRAGGKRTGYYEASGEPVYRAGQFAGFRGLTWDVTEREALIARLTESEGRFRALTELSSDWYWEMGADLRFTRLRRGAHGSFDLDDARVIGRHRWDLPGELVQPASWDIHRATLRAREPFRDLMVRRWDAGGAVVYHLTSGDPVFDVHGQFCGYRGVGKNITEQVRAQERIERLATIDPLTQLPNRQTFDERSGQVLSNAYADGRTCALLFIDLDNFRLLNNGYGHRVGDQVLSTVASRMRAIVNEPHLTGRRGGDELVVLLADLPRDLVAIEIAQALIRSISEPMRVFGMEITVTPSVGISYFPRDGVDLDSLLNAADAAMYQAKESGRKTYALYTSSVARRVDLRLRLEQRLRKAVEARDFKLYFQPLVSLDDGKMMGAEALIRWKDIELGDISPAEFIPIAEESGLIVALGDWVIREAARSRQLWRQLGLDVPPVALNFSGVQLRQTGCVEGLLNALDEFDVNPGEIEVEVTETGLLETTALARENLIRMRNAGVRLALDDFGVGFSSLSHLRDLPIHRLKIDRSFTVECMRDARTLTIVKAVIEMARSLGISVTAEGIETQAQQTWMQHLGCDTAQGYLFARPMPPEDFVKLFLDKRGVGRERSLMH